MKVAQIAKSVFSPLVVSAVLAIAVAPAQAGNKGGQKDKQERLLVCHYNDEGELKAKLLPAKAAKRHYKNHFPSEEPYTWENGEIRCDAEPQDPVVDWGDCPCVKEGAIWTQPTQYPMGLGTLDLSTLVGQYAPLSGPQLSFTANDATPTTTADTLTILRYNDGSGGLLFVAHNRISNSTGEALGLCAIVNTGYAGSPPGFGDQSEFVYDPRTPSPIVSDCARGLAQVAGLESPVPED